MLFFNFTLCTLKIACIKSSFEIGRDLQYYLKAFNFDGQKAYYNFIIAFLCLHSCISILLLVLFWITQVLLELINDGLSLFLYTLYKII